MTARSTFRPILLATAAVLVVGAAPAAAFNPQPDPPGSAHPEHLVTNSAAVTDSVDPHVRALIRGEVN
jgi:hypothetical protein